MLKPLCALLAGLLFGLGLWVSGMTDPAKVLGFLNLKNWDPSLALVMVGAIGVGFWSFRAARRHVQGCLGEPFHNPAKRHIDGRLVIGSLVFGCGWGLAGICPGPAVATLGSGTWQPFWFLGMVLVGMYAADLIERKLYLKRKPL